MNDREIFGVHDYLPSQKRLSDVLTKHGISPVMNWAIIYLIETEEELELVYKMLKDDPKVSGTKIANTLAKIKMRTSH